MSSSISDTSNDNQISESYSTSICSDVNINWKGTIIQNKYIIIHKIGSGSYCSVWLTYDFINNKEFALKIYNREDYDDAKNEINIFDDLKKLHINNIILYEHYMEYESESKTESNSNSNSESESESESGKFDSDSDENNKFVLLFMPLCGYSLYNIFKIIGLKDVNVNQLDINIYKSYIDLVYDSVLTVNSILKSLHANGYVHSDIKPENILIKKPSIECSLILEKVKQKISELKNNEKLKNKFNMFKKNKKNKKNNNNKNNNIISWLAELKTYISNLDLSELNITSENILNYIFNSPNEIILCDMGTTLKINDRIILKKHTTYYKAPEIILNLDYDGTYDLWSLGCSIYEMLCGNVLFNPFDFELTEQYGENEDINLLYLMVSSLGLPDYNFINKSKLKEIFFTNNYKTLKGFSAIKYNSILNNLINKNIFQLETDSSIYNKINELILMMYTYLNYDPKKRFLVTN
jgi:serine/threonine protein kinase